MPWQGFSAAARDGLLRLNTAEGQILGAGRTVKARRAFRPVGMSDAVGTLLPMLRGTVLAESLRVGAAMEVAGLRMARVARRDVSQSATSGQPSVWTFLEFEADDEVADVLAQSLAESLLEEGGWYADFVVGQDHVVVFAGQVFRYRRGDHARRAEVAEYGKSVGVPHHQLDWGD